ncbi:Glycosyltransferase [Quillaja saponaria]|uniref:Glycosyltransferase n=1 Tax=Quillaja saponaria TaxID=32244 RepID=A0AAD7VFN4_QUISA|nr:Glycosyltransferase [Quillaja saponaria]
MEGAIVLYPSPAIGHLISMIELGKLILTHKPSLSIHILITTPPYSGGSTASDIATVSSTFPSITFHNLPTITPPPTIAASTPNHETLTFEVIRLNNPNVHQSLLSISESYSIQAFIFDFFCTQSLLVTSQLNIPAYYFSTSGATSFASVLDL